VTEADIRRVVADVLAEQSRKSTTDEVVLKTVAAILTTFGMDDDDRMELRADFQHLRRWRKSVEQAGSFTMRAAITVVVSGLLGALWLGFKVMTGK